MSSNQSVTQLIRKLEAGDRMAIQQLWESYFGRMVALARRKLQGVPRGDADEEDVALNAFYSVCRGVEEGRFPQLSDRDDLWHLLVLLTVRKAINQAKHERAAKRGGGRVIAASALPEGSDALSVLSAVIGQEPDPAFAAEATEECRRLLDKLKDENLRKIAEWKMEGYTNDQIAKKLGRSTVTVEKKLRSIRTIWEKECPS